MSVLITQLAEDNTPVPLSEALNKARTRVGFSVEAAASCVGISTDRLREVEAGLGDPSPSLIDDLANLYGISPTALPNREITEREPLRYDAATGTLYVSWLTVDYAPHRNPDHDNDYLLRSYARAVREMRNMAETGRVHLRTADQPGLAPLLNLDDPHLEQRFAYWLAGAEGDFAGIADTLRSHLHVTPDESGSD